MRRSVVFVGLGVMGCPMAENLGKSGFEVVGFTRSERSRERARRRGIAVVDELAALPTSPDVVVTMLPDGPDVEAVLCEPGGLLARTKGPATFVDMSTISPDVARRIGERVAAAGHRFVDAPVSGGEAGAVDANLSIMVGGSEADVTRLGDVFRALGSTIVHVGPIGAGQVTKAANQMIVAGNLAILAEAVVFVTEQGIDPEAALAVIAGGLGGSTVIARKAQAMLRAEYNPGFRLTLHAKDLSIVEQETAALGLTLPMTGLVTGLVRSLVASGRGDLDHSALHLQAAETAHG